MSASCGHSHDFDGTSATYRRRLWIVIAINAAMFVVEMTAGQFARSQALQADALEFFSRLLRHTGSRSPSSDRLFGCGQTRRWSRG